VIDFTIVLVPKDENGCKFIGSFALLQLSLMTSLLLVGTIIRCRDLQDAGATAAQKESQRVIEMPTAFVLTFSIPRGAFP
jgi:hypothetical protein